MELKKYHANQVLHIIRHNMRALPTYGNSSIVPELVGKNEELISRGKTPEEVNEYRKNLEKEIFKYNRKNLVHAVSVVIQCPDDCPAEEEENFSRSAISSGWIACQWGNDASSKPSSTGMKL